MSATNALELLIINHFFRNSAQTPAAQLYAACLTAVADEEAGTVTELAGGAYARKAISFDAPAAGGSTQNSAQVLFDGGAGTVTHIGIYTAASGGTLLAVGALAASRTVAVGEQLTFEAGTITLSLN